MLFVVTNGFSKYPLYTFANSSELACLDQSLLPELTDDAYELIVDSSENGSSSLALLLVPSEVASSGPVERAKALLDAVSGCACLGRVRTLSRDDRAERGGSVEGVAEDELREMVGYRGRAG